ncbi:MAG: sensor signal transduction histidine kinase [Micavibrio sp.]|nr:sensor signal transduction histidine kinase [Micavibrio sp.]
MILDKILKQSYEKRALAYFMAVAMVILVVFLRMAVYEISGHKAPYGLFYGAVPIVGIIGGFWPAFLTTVLGALIGHYLSITGWRFEINPLDPPAMIIFLCTAVIISLLCEELRQVNRAKEREAEAARGEAAERVRLAQELTSMAFARTAAEERFRIAQEVSPVGFVLLDTIRDSHSNKIIDMRWSYINPAAKKILPEDADTGKCLLEVYKPTSDLEQMLARYERVISLNEAWQGDIPWYISEFNGWLSIRVVKVDDGVAVSFSDITQQMQLQNDLKVSNDELKINDHKKDEFLAILAHELRNPLAPIRNGLSILERAQDKPELGKEVRGMMSRQVDQMVRLVDDLMDVSRINRGRINLNKIPMLLGDAIENAIETAQPLIAAGGHRLDVDVGSGAVYLNGDIVRLSQAFANLLNNAAKYTDKGGVIALTLGQENGFAVVTVKDTGIGISAEMLPRLFEMFSQHDGSLERAQGGLGIGLSLVKNIVEHHGGTTRAESEGIGKGSVFTIRLPSQAQPAAAAATGYATDGAEQLPLRVLVVDDNAESAQTLGWAIELSGHEVKIETSSEKALSLARDFVPQIVLLDIGMPGMNGYELCAAMKQIPGLEQAVFIAQTGWGQEKHRQLSKDAGFDHHLVKPIDNSSLQNLVFQAGRSVR